MEDDDLKATLKKAVEENNSESIRILVNKGADFLSKYEDGSTFLHLAVQCKSVDTIPTLVELGIPIDSERNFDHVTPMLLAIEMDDVSIMEILKSLGANLLWEDCDSYTLLSNAAFWGANNAIDWLLKNGVSIDPTGRGNSEGPLNLAAHNGHISTFKKFLDLGLDVNSCCCQNQWTPLHKAAWSGQLEMINFLIKCGANVNARNLDGNTPLHWAVENGSPACVELLIEKGAEVNLGGNKGDTPLHWVAENGYVSVCQTLLKHGADVNCRDKSLDTPLTLAIKHNQKEIVEELKSRGALT